MKAYLGIDGGGSHTHAILVSPRGRVLGRGEAGPSNYHGVGLKVAGANLRKAAERAWADAGQPFQAAAAAFLGCAGVKAERDAARVTAEAEGVGLAPAGQVTVVNDLHNALAGGLAGQPGIALIAGTGTNCLGRDATGATCMCGGWGWLLDDEGGGFGLAVAALRAAVRGADGRIPPTRLLPAGLAFFGLTHPDELLARLYVDAWTPDEVAAFAPVVMRLAEEGDAAAIGVLRNGAAALAGLVAGAAKPLSFPAGPSVVVLGGCARSGSPYQPMIEAAIRRLCPEARLGAPALSPVHGAAVNCLRAAGCDPRPLLDLLAAHIPC
ncbi:MAG: ATPase [Opitutaceae bacterium]|nr:ATPase [Opitutaceae bacterium]